MPAAQDLCGKTLKERYRLTELLGAGGMGQVYAGIDQTLDRPVAVKVLLNKFADDSRSQQRFLREAKAASKIQHPNVVQILDFGETPDGAAFYAMEFLDGCDLAALLHAEGSLSWARTRNILLQIVKALAATHERNIIHRDIKPANFYVLNARGHHDFIKLLDFGIAKSSSDSNTDKSMGASLTGAGEVMGTAKYMAPEQAYGSSNDPRIDIYAVGVVAYQLLTGVVPFTGKSAFEILKKHVEEQPKPPREHDPLIPPEVETIVLRAMAKDATQRYSTMDELGLALAGVSARARGSAAPPVAPHRTRDPGATVPAGSGSGAGRGPRSRAGQSSTQWTPVGASTAVVATTPRRPSSVAHGEMGHRDRSAPGNTVLPPGGAAASTPGSAVAQHVPAGGTLPPPPSPSPDPGGSLVDDPSTGATGRNEGLRDERIATFPSVGAITGVETSPQLRPAPPPEKRGGAGVVLAGLIGILVLGGAGTAGVMALSSSDPDPVSAKGLAMTNEPESEADDEAAAGAPVAADSAEEAAAPDATPAEVDAAAAEPASPDAVAAPEPNEPEPAAEVPSAKKKSSRSKSRKSGSPKTRKPAPAPAPTGPGEDSQVSARLAKSVARKCKEHGSGQTVTVDLIVSSKGKVVTRTAAGVSAELRSCLLAGVGGATFREGSTRKVSLRVAL
ncbi:MAG: protein kinase [Myxococcota bacterium]